MNKDKLINITSLAIAITIIILYSIILLPKRVYYRLSFLLNNTYYYPIYFLVIIAFAIIFLKLFQKIKIKDNTLKIIYGLFFLPAVYFPIMRCYFKVPYIFCKTCPRKCPFGELRPFIIPSFLLLNLDKRFWCFKLCPFGTLQDYQCRVSKKRIHLPKWLSKIRYIFLALTAIAVLGLIFTPTYFDFFFKGEHHLYLWTFVISLIIFLLAFFIPRFFCNYFCPIGSFGDIALKAQNKFKR